jgi:hypothetical protein
MELNYFKLTILNVFINYLSKKKKYIKMPMIQVSVKDMKGIETPLNIDDNKTINQGKAMLGHDVNRVWKYDGNILDGNQTFSFYEIENGETIIATEKVVGGIK